MTIERVGALPVAPLTRRRIPLDRVAPVPSPAGLSLSGTGEAVPASEREDAMICGYREGFAQGMADAALELERLMSERIRAQEEAFVKRRESMVSELAASRARLLKLVASVQREQEAQRGASEELAIEIAYTALGRLLGERAQARTLVAEWCRQVAAELASAPCRLRLAPADAEIVDAWTAEVELVADPRLAPGSIVLESARGEVHASLELRLEAIKQVLLETLAESKEHHRAPGR